MRWLGWIAAVVGVLVGALVAYLGGGGSPGRVLSSAAPARSGVAEFGGGAARRDEDGPRERPVVPEPEPRPEGARPPAGYQEGMGRPPRRDGTARRLARAVRWTESLDAAAALPEQSPGDLLDRWKEALALATDPRARQNIIFQAALVLPFDVARPWLEEIRSGEDADDAEDALLALAFSGEADARAAFALLARTPEDPALLRSICVPETRAAIEALPPEAARRVRRSHRAIEVLDREPYFEHVCVEASYRWRDHPVVMLDDWHRLESELLRHWVRRYPGHTGSDDMALRIARNETDPMEAARWYGRAATWPDQDVTDGALFGLVTMAEMHLTPGQIDRLAHEEGLDTPNRMLLLYVRLRRIAADRDFEEAVREAGARAAAEPDCSIARAWRRRWSMPPSRGLDSGLRPLAPDDPLRVVRPEPEEDPRPGTEGRRPVRLSRYHFPPYAEGRPDAGTLPEPAKERLLLDESALARQFRAWETLAELERRARRAARAERSDLLYKQAAVYYHERDAIYPIWAAHSEYIPNIFRDRNALRGDREQEEARERRFRDRALSYRRAIGIFDRIESEDGSYSGMDRVLFSRAMARKKLMEIRPFRPWEDEVRHAMIRSFVADFERCAAHDPRGELAGPARRAASWWRRNVPAAWASAAPR